MSSSGTQQQQLGVLRQWVLTSDSITLSSKVPGMYCVDYTESQRRLVGWNTDLKEGQITNNYTSYTLHEA